jgi:hypothetical protein
VFPDAEQMAAVLTLQVLHDYSDRETVLKFRSYTAAASQAANTARICSP